MKQCWREKLWKGHPLLARRALTSLRSTLADEHCKFTGFLGVFAPGTHDSTEPAIVRTFQRMCISYLKVSFAVAENLNLAEKHRPTPLTNH